MMHRDACAIAAVLTCAAAAIAGQMRPAEHELIPMATTNGRSMDVELADLDGDGDADLIIASEYGQNAVLLREGDRFRHAPDAITQGPRHDSEDIAVADLDGDGRPDLVFVSEDDQTNELYVNRGGGAFDDRSDRLPTTGVSNAVAAFDCDGDGDVDLLLGNKGQNHLLINAGDGTFADATSERLPKLADVTQDLEIGDIDGDGDPDVIVGNEDANRVLINDGAGRFADETAERLGLRSAEETREADLGDLDGDGDLDLVFANVGWGGGDPRDVVLLNDGAGRFEAIDAEAFPAPSVFSLDADLADIDGDGDLDIVTAQITPGVGRPASVFLNDGQARFEDASEALIPAAAKGHGIDVEVADLNGDGRPDLYIGNHLSADLILLQ